MHIIINEKEVMNVKEQAGVYERVWTEERLGRNDGITL